MHLARRVKTSVQSTISLQMQDLLEGSALDNRHVWEDARTRLWMKLVMMMSCIDLGPRCEVPSGKADMLRSARATKCVISRHPQSGLVRPQNQSRRSCPPAF